ncbi:MAG: LCP family protein [Clostridiaceae bacterium]
MGTRVEKSKEHKKKGKLKYIIIGIIAVILLLVCLAVGYFWSKLSAIDKVDINKSNLNISSDAQDMQETHDDVINIALYGLDSRAENNDGSRSDSIMVLTIDKTKNKIKISSIVRDTYVNIPGRGMDKINHAYAFGGPELAISTINNNFGLAIQDFVTVDFFGLAKVVDSIGGVQLDIQSDEIQHMNKYIDEISSLEGVNADYITNSGKQNVSGIQAVAYARVRYTAGGDFKRAERQRVLLMTIFEKIKTMNKTQYIDVINQLLPNVKTNMSSTNLISLAVDVLSSGNSTIEQMKFPLDKNSGGQTINGVYYYVTDLDESKKALQDYIYNDVKPN